MSLVDIIKDEGLKEKLTGREISINPESGYEKKDFVQHSDDYFDLAGYYSALRNNNGDIDAMNDIAKILIPENPRQLLVTGTEGCLLAANVAASKAGVNLAKYTEKNSLVDKLEAEELNTVVLQLGNPENPYIFKTGDKKHDKLAEIVKGQSALAFRKIDVLKEDIPELMKDAPEWHQAVFSRYSGDQEYMNVFIESYAGVISALYEKYFTVGKGKDKKLDREELYKFYDENLKCAKDAIDKEENQKTKYGIWDDNIKPIDLIIANVLYRREKAELKKQEPTEAERRKEERKKAGLR